MRKTISRVGLSAVLVLILALVCLPSTGLGATEQSFTGKVIGIECSTVSIIVRISVNGREGITEQEASAQRRPSIEEVRMDISCQAKESSIWKFIRKKTRKKEVTVRFSGVDRGNHPMADVLLPGDQSLRALIEARFFNPALKN
ncbi:MAG: hypothetical protein H0U54_04330 [Acidobacteria bacterium]|nr:hypothetical protein [Acidobacteriota bacterium]